MRRCVLLAVLFAIVLAPSLPSTAWSQSGRQGYYRFPALHGDTLVFSAEGDLWKVPVTGGVAQRLTTHAEQETDPAISPDGTTVAFSARYEGPAELYTMPLNGGLPVRQTYESEASIPTGWTPDGRVLYRTSHYATLPVAQLVTLDLETGARHRVPLATANEGAYDDSGTTLFFVRPSFHGNVTKRYVGGTARKIWKYVDGADEAVRLTGDYDGGSHTPMWWDGRVYFISDRDGTMNIWSMDVDGGNLRQHTGHSGWDVRDASLHGGRIAYQVGADIWTYDIASGDDGVVPITLASDFDQLREKWVDEPMSYLTSAHIHPEGESVVLTARGRVFVAPAGDGRLVRASRAEGVRYRDVVFMPDGDSLLALSDETGELDFVRLPANGVGDARPLTDNGTILRFTGYPSPDGKWIAFTDNNNDLTLLEVDTGAQRVISTNREGIGDIAWSPDSRWVAYIQGATNSYAQIWIRDVAADAPVAVTSDRVNSMSPAWSPDGEWLYFLSDRNLRTIVGSPWGPRQPEPFFDRTMKIYEVALEEGLRSRFRVADELAIGDEGDGGEDGPSPRGSDGDEDDSDGGVDPVEIDLDGLQRRLREVPVEPGNYAGLSVNDGALFWSARETGGFGAARHLMGLEIGNDDPKPQTVVENISFGEMSQDGKKILVRSRNDLYVIDAQVRKVSDLGDKRVDLGSWSFSIDVAKDWRQIFIDAWRLERDYFYDPGMHGVDWDAVGEKYLTLVDRVTTREELSDLIGRAVGELSALHTSVRGGDMRQDEDDVAVATLGARLVRDPAAGGYLVEYIYRTDPDYPDERSPLADPDLGIEPGAVIEAVNGAEALSVPHIGALLRNQEGRQVLLRIRDADAGEGDGGRDVIVTPRSSGYGLRYNDWEYTRRLRVEERGDTDIGYVHLRAMGGSDLNAWYRQFYPVYDRQGLIVDVRSNNGGNIDSIILEKLMRQAWFYWRTRVGRPTWNLQYAFRGHMVVLVDEDTASDGEAFAEGFRRLGLGPVIGARTWGGEIWLSSTNRLSDGGLARAPMMGVYSADGEWLIEGWGVVPDIEVINLPRATFDGDDAQLDAAIDYLLEKIEEDPRPIPAAPAYPDKSFEYRQRQDAEGGGGR